MTGNDGARAVPTKAMPQRNAPPQHPSAPVADRGIHHAVEGIHVVLQVGRQAAPPGWRWRWRRRWRMGRRSWSSRRCSPWLVQRRCRRLLHRAATAGEEDEHSADSGGGHRRHWSTGVGLVQVQCTAPPPTVGRDGSLFLNADHDAKAAFATGLVGGVTGRRRWLKACDVMEAESAEQSGASMPSQGGHG